ncbi:MAG: SDR family oxidoreductase [Vulcanimicrobiota bacterium]
MILVTGATGTNGRQIVQALREAGQPVRALLREPDRAQALASLGADLCPGDFNQPNLLRKALQGVERALLLTPVTEAAEEWSGNFVQLAQAAGVAHLVRFSGMGANLEAPVEILRQHARADQQLKNSGLQWTLLQPNSFYQNLLWAADGVRTQSRLYQLMGQARQSLVDVWDIARVAVAALTGPGHHGQVYTLTGPEALAMGEIAERLGQLLGRSISYVPLGAAQVRQQMLDSGAPDWNAREVTALLEYFAEGRAAEVTSTIEDVTGRPARSVTDFLKQSLEAFQ